MKRSVAAARTMLTALVATSVVACRSTPRPAAPATPAPAAAPAAPAVPAHDHMAMAAPAEKADSARHGYVAADVRFMQHMIAHHAQALQMTSLLQSRSAHPGMRLLAERIDVSQRDEIAMMQQWLRTRGERVPAPPTTLADHAGHDMAAMGDSAHATMPGMLAPAELARLAGTSGAEFDRLFLEYMIRHHEGALTMVAEYLRAPGAAQEPESFRFASDVDADQRAEIARMRALLGARQ